MRKSSFWRTARLLACLALAAAPAAAEAAAPEQLLLEVEINGQQLPEPQLLVRGEDGGIYASAAAVKAWRLNIVSTNELQHDGQSYRRIDGGGVRVALSEADQRIRIHAAPELFERQASALRTAEEIAMTPSGTGGFFNYDMFVEHGAGPARISGAFELAAFSRYGVATTRLIGSIRPGASVTRLDSSWALDRPGRMWSVRIGDSLTRGGSSAAPLRFGGIQIGRNFALQPGFVTIPLPSIEGQAAVPSVADVYVNNMLQGSSNLAPGPFEIRNVPIQSGAGQVQLVVRDLLGREIVSSQSYYASSEMLRRGLHDFSFELGLLRHNFGVRSNDYRGFIASTAHRYGLTDAATIEAHAQFTSRLQSLGAGATVTLGDVALLNGGASLSRSALGTGWKLTGAAERRSSGLSLGIRSDLASRFHAQPGAAEERQPRLNVQGYADAPLGRMSLGVNFSHRSFRGAPAESFIGTFATVPLSGAGSLQLFARHARGARTNTALGAHFAVSLGGRRSASSSLEWSRNGRYSSLSYQQDAPFGTGFGYRTNVGIGPTRTYDASFDYHASAANFSVQASRAGGRTAGRLTASGAAGLVAGKGFASRSLNSSFAAVRVPGYSGVRVYADNQLVGATDASGTLIVPALRPFEKNAIRIDESDLPLDAQIAQVEHKVRPFSRSGSLVEFAVRREKGALLRVSLEDGSDLPAGAELLVEGLDEPFVAVSGGEAYVRFLTGRARVLAKWAGRSCSFEVALPATDDPQPRIEGLICREAAQLAAR